MSVSSTKNNKISEINIYPNPNSGLFTLSGINKVTEVSVIDLQGKLLGIYQTSTDGYLDLNNLPNGVYCLYFVEYQQTATIVIVK